MYFFGYLRDIRVYIAVTPRGVNSYQSRVSCYTTIGQDVRCHQPSVMSR